jgi:hypothetical protein
MLNRDQIILNFFDFSQPCPSEIPYCEQFRSKYQDEINRLDTNGCTPCKKNDVKAKYMKDVWEQALLKTI